MILQTIRCLQGRLHSYLDTQISRLGGANFHEIPINRPIAEIHNNQRDGQFRHDINKGRVAYEPNSLGGGCPYQSMIEDGGFSSYEEKIDGRKIRDRSESFTDHFTQAALFFNSQADYEQQHIIDAISFELGKVETNHIRSRVVYVLNQINEKLANGVADNLGIEIPKNSIRRSITAFRRARIWRNTNRNRKKPADSKKIRRSVWIRPLKTR